MAYEDLGLIFNTIDCPSSHILHDYWTQSQEGPLNQSKWTHIHMCMHSHTDTQTQLTCIHYLARSALVLSPCLEFSILHGFNHSVVDGFTQKTDNIPYFYNNSLKFEWCEWKGYRCAKSIFQEAMFFWKLRSLSQGSLKPFSRIIPFWHPLLRPCET